MVWFFLFYFIIFLLPSCSVALCEVVMFRGNSVLAGAELSKKTCVSETYCSP